MLDFNAPNGYKVRVYAGSVINVCKPDTNRVCAIYTSRHGDTVYPDSYPVMVSAREALAYGKQRIWATDSNE